MKTIDIKSALDLPNTIFIDVRTQAEFEEDHIRDAFHMPLFNDDEHKDIGTIYKMQGKQEAVQKGFDYVKDKLKHMYMEVLSLANEYENIVIYCARGGMRSGSLVNMISTLGVNVYQLQGGYKAYRNFVLDYFKTVMDTKEFIVLHGLTGVGKTDALLMLEENGIDIIDLEGLAKNSGSTFGFIMFNEKPPTQKNFETNIFEKLYFSKSNYIFIESESKRVGHVNVPHEIYEGIVRDGYHILLECSVKSRVDRLCRDYIYTENKNFEALIQCINKFRKRLGNQKVDYYIELFNEGKYDQVVEHYLVDYYDALYGHSVQKYEYNRVLNCDNMKKAVLELIDFHKAAKEGAN
ncbi:tRNA 2-selenouridine(34) synthase MnmH [Paraclostridium bifermentans]|uniref:tRNA 2-selenouridine(34) synthase MnmH n=1 Tax=Paraclostridium bifermentans TaxID=1490 RepID=UPI001C108BB2|nr:tRNA 2-selenouridine(34) synthase MnmH [Paraclostridium bifermentans]MBS5954614.1 tRNA 2-selenouridine(34) synthase MnmH [Paraclostridium bifermentans]MBU5288218.1 tRNA 2-selenouridine(34) synthase MnmH [Paraclostridium bifermentans]